LVRGQAALAEAAAVDARPDRPGLALAGVPVAVKDNIAVTGEPMRVGSQASLAGPRTRDHLVVARLRAAGAVVVGVTRMPELAVWAFTDGRFGMARNPWDLSRTCGGSSGGSAAAVAAALVPLAHGNDGLGSIRVPAAACGLVGVKPGFGVVPAGPGADVWCSMGENGPIATTVADAALGLSVMAGNPALARVDRPPGGVRIALVTGAPVPGSRVDRHGRALPVTSPICWPARATRWNRRSCRSRCGHGGRCTPAGSRPPRTARPRLAWTARPWRRVPVGRRGRDGSPPAGMGPAGRHRALPGGAGPVLRPP
jgi:hypothetical protein